MTKNMIENETPEEQAANAQAAYEAKIAVAAGRARLQAERDAAVQRRRAMMRVVGD
jgi:hypothetical protein